MSIALDGGVVFEAMSEYWNFVYEGPMFPPLVKGLSWLPLLQFPSEERTALRAS
jgi:hypothetical protein